MQLNKWAKSAGAAALVSAVICLVSSVLSLINMGTVYGIAPGAGDAVLYLYHINAFFCVFAALFASAVLRDTTFSASSRICGWAMLFLAVASVTPFITDAVPYLGEMGASAGFQYTCAYIPFFAVIAGLTAWISLWNVRLHAAYRGLTMACALAAVFCCVDYLWQLVPLLGQAQSAYDLWRLIGMLSGFLCVTLTCVLLWCLPEAGVSSAAAQDNTAEVPGAGGEMTGMPPIPQESVEADSRISKSQDSDGQTS